MDTGPVHGHLPARRLPGVAGTHRGLINTA